MLAGGLLVGVASPATVAGLPRESWSTLAVGDVMRPIADVPVVEPDDLLAEAAAQLGGGLDRIPVAVDGALVGVVTVGALARALGARAREAAAS